MANVKPFNIVAGPAKAYIAPVGTPFPLVGDAEATFAGGTNAWHSLGKTDGGVKVMHTQTVIELRADQVTAPIKAVRSEEGLQITFSLAELSLENYADVMNHSVAGPTTSGGAKSIKLYRGGSQVETVALLVRGDHLSPYGDFNLQYEVPAVYQSAAPEIAFTKDAKALLAVTLNAIGDPDATSDADLFGTLRAATA